MNKRPHSWSESPRIAELVEQFKRIGEKAMCELPIYNPELEVEAIGFRRVDGHWIGILITPWFMNLMRVPQEAVPMQMAHLGRRLKVTLPSGDRELMQGGDEVLGSYESLSLHSPMFAFQTQKAAQQEAERQLADLMQPSEQPLPDENGRLHAEEKARKISRRVFLRGAT
ncbi:MAG: [NiFe]-hydrogenase assembly chaperone HybE [Chromatiaceae bacterium]|jgi:[NiFe] hydrogenase assembly HybE family chaperone|nr:[NiFe]-hydrogenase assembly chaperone HybE [Chromatiaceae bacterium]